MTTLGSLANVCPRLPLSLGKQSKISNFITGSFYFTFRIQLGSIIPKHKRTSHTQYFKFRIKEVLRDMIQERIQDSRLEEGRQYNPWLSGGWKMLTLDL